MYFNQLNVSIDIENEGKTPRDMLQRNNKDHTLLYMHLNDLEVDMHVLCDGSKRRA